MTRQFFCTEMIFRQLLWTPTLMCSQALSLHHFCSLLLFIEVQVSFLCWLNSMEDRNRWMNLKMDYYFFSNSRWWNVVFRAWQEAQFGILLFCECTGTEGQGVGTGPGCALYTSTPKLLGTSAALAGNCGSPCVQLSLECPNSHCSFSSAAAKPHRAPGEGRESQTQKSPPVCPQHIL